MSTNPTLSDNELQALAYFAVGVSSEGNLDGRDISNQLSIAANTRDGKLYPVGNSGYSFGTLQVDLGQHPEMAPSLVSAYQAWAANAHPHENWVLNSDQETKTINDLARDGHTIQQDDGRPLDPTVKSHLDAFLKSNDGISFVHSHDVSQVDHLTRQPDGRDHGSAVVQLQSTSLYQHASVDDQARLATIMIKLENQSGDSYYPRVLKDINDGGLHNVEEVENRVAGLIPRRHDKPSYIESGMDQALNGTEAFLKLRDAAPGSPQHNAWQSVVADPLVNPAKANDNPTLGADYQAVKDQFLHANVQRHIQRDHAHPSLHQGMSGESVRNLQAQLGELDYLPNTGTPDGKFGPATRDAVKAFQRDSHLSDDGVAGRATEQAIQGDLKPLKQDAPGLLPSVSGMSGLPAAMQGVDDPRNPLNPDHALYNDIRERLPDASENRLLQFTAACHSNGINAQNLSAVHFDQKNGVVSFGATNDIFAKVASIDVKTPSPPAEQSIQQIQHFDQTQAQIAAMGQAQNQAQAQLGPMPGGH